MATRHTPVIPTRHDPKAGRGPASRSSPTGPCGSRLTTSGDSGYGDDGAWHDEEERVAVARLLGRLHAATVPGEASPFSYTLPHRELAEAVTRGDTGPWLAGPYGEPARALLHERGQGIQALLARYDGLVARARADPDHCVMTHGEPHRGNVIRQGATMHLVDRETARVAPRERDLRDVLRADADDPAWAAYRSTAGDVECRPHVMELFHAWWDLSEIGEYAHWFRGPHADTADDRTAWGGLRCSADVPRRWPVVE